MILFRPLSNGVAITVWHGCDGPEQELSVDVVVNGEVAEGFEPVRDAFLRNFRQLGERGAAVTVYRHGRRVVDLWAGTKDVDGTAPRERGTAHVVRSATKGVAAAVLLLLHQRGELDLDAPVGEYWPEYKAAGKERTLVRHVLAHCAGVPALDRPLTWQEAADPDHAADCVAAQAPAWEPGTDHGYHAHTYGFLTGELVRRVTGRSLGTWLADEITGPAGIDLWVGFPGAAGRSRPEPGSQPRPEPWRQSQPELRPESEAQLPSGSEVWSPSAPDLARVGRTAHVKFEAPAGTPRTRPKRAVADAYADSTSLTSRAFAVLTPFPDENDPAYRAAEFPSSNGIATSDGLARFYASLISEVDGRPPLWTPPTLALARAEHSAGPDRVLVVPTRFGAGYMLHCPASPFLAPTSFGHPGRGGALGFADPESGIAFGYITNGYRSSVTADARAQSLIRGVRVALGL
jgi:CubicO group peptidase (beta-lactamase class C family)